MYQFFSLLYSIETSRVSESVRKSLRVISDWCLENEYSYIILYKFNGARYHLPKYENDRVVLYEAY